MSSSPPQPLVRLVTLMCGTFSVISITPPLVICRHVRLRRRVLAQYRQSDLGSADARCAQLSGGHRRGPVLREHVIRRRVGLLHVRLEHVHGPIRGAHITRCVVYECCALPRRCIRLMRGLPLERVRRHATGPCTCAHTVPPGSPPRLVISPSCSHATCAAGIIDTRTTYTTSQTVYLPRGVASTDGSQIWLADGHALW